MILNYYNDSFTEICDAIFNTLREILLLWTEEFSNEDTKEYKQFIGDVKEFCLESVCQNDNDCTEFTQNMNKILEEFVFD